MDAYPPVLLMRGLPGSGKTTWIDTHWRRAYVCSADQFFMSTGKYVFDSRKLQEAHSTCLRRYVKILDDVFSSHTLCDAMTAVIVDNTNLKAWELAPYWSTALAFGFRPRIITLMCDWRDAAARCTHGVPQHKIFRMWQTLQKEELPWEEEIYWTDREAT